MQYLRPRRAHPLAFARGENRDLHRHFSWVWDYRIFVRQSPRAPHSIHGGRMRGMTIETFQGVTTAEGVLAAGNPRGLHEAEPRWRSFASNPLESRHGGHRGIQPKGRCREDDDFTEPPCGAGAAQAEAAGYRSGPAGASVGHLRHTAEIGRRLGVFVLRAPATTGGSLRDHGERGFPVPRPSRADETSIPCWAKASTS